MDQQHQFCLQQRTATPQAATLALSVSPQHAQVQIIRATIIGPYCEYSNTLPAKIPLKSVPLAAELLVTIPDPCYWTARLPFTYRLEIEYHGEDASTVEHSTLNLGLRRNEFRSGVLFCDGQRTVLRAIAWSAVWQEPVWRELRDTGTSLLLTTYHLEWFKQAARYGVPIILDQRAATDIVLDWHTLPRNAAVTLVLVPAALLRDQRFVQESGYIRLGFDQRERIAASEQGHAAQGKDLQNSCVMCDATQVSDLLNSLRTNSNVGESCAILASGQSVSPTWLERRRECDDLQAKLAKLGDMAAYIILDQSV